MTRFPIIQRWQSWVTSRVLGKSLVMVTAFKTGEFMLAHFIELGRHLGKSMLGSGYRVFWQLGKLGKLGILNRISKMFGVFFGLMNDWTRFELTRRYTLGIPDGMGTSVISYVEKWRGIL